MAFSIERHHGSYNISRRSTTVKYIVVHYTGSGTSSAGSALANCQYFAGGNRNASANYFVDDATICEYADPSAYYTWHCGDGHGKYGISNSNSIGIEVCRNGNQPYTEAEIDRLAWLVRKLMADFGVPADRVVRHYDASRKACPYYYTPSGAGGDSAWNSLHARITSGGTEDEVTNEDIQNIAAACASYVYGDSDKSANLNMYNAVHWGYWRVVQCQTEITALSEAVKTLATANGADPDEIAKAVSDAVAKKLESIDLSVTVTDD